MSSTQEKPRKKNKPLLCNCDGFWHITGFTDDKEQEYSIDVHDQVQALIDSAKREAVLTELKWAKGASVWNIESRIAQLEQSED